MAHLPSPHKTCPSKRIQTPPSVPCHEGKSFVSSDTASSRTGPQSGPKLNFYACVLVCSTTWCSSSRDLLWSKMIFKKISFVSREQWCVVLFTLGTRAVAAEQEGARNWEGDEGRKALEQLVNPQYQSLWIARAPSSEQCGIIWRLNSLLQWKVRSSKCDNWDRWRGVFFASSVKSYRYHEYDPARLGEVWIVEHSLSIIMLNKLCNVVARSGVVLGWVFVQPEPKVLWEKNQNEAVQ